MGRKMDACSCGRRKASKSLECKQCKIDRKALNMICECGKQKSNPKAKICWDCYTKNKEASSIRTAYGVCPECGGEKSRDKRIKLCWDCAKKAKKKTGTYRYVTTGGYVALVIDGVRMQEHRYVMEQALERKLLSTENVHHINGDKIDNRLENLELWSMSQPAGQRIEDKVAHAVTILQQYAPHLLQKTVDIVCEAI